MIELRTGLPGACKTLSMVESLHRLQKSWEKKPDEARPVFVHGITDLALPHSPLPLVQWRENAQKPFQWVPDWDSLPAGALVIIDEGQSLFPPRSSQSKPPPHVAFLNTHRHHGLDVWIATQNPKLIDFSVRALVGKHQHFRRLFGRQRSVVYEFDGCNDSLANLSSAVLSYYPYPKRAFEWYKSAEVHTKQSFKLPKWILIPILGALSGIVFIPRAATVLANGMSGKGVASEHKETREKPPQAGASAAVAAVSAQPVRQDIEKQLPPLRADNKPSTPFTRPVVLAAACLANSTKCQCYTKEGAHVSLPDDLCRQAAASNINFAAIPAL